MTRKSVLKENEPVSKDAPINNSRRNFLAYAGAASGLLLLGSSCAKDYTPPASTGNKSVDLGSGDVGILNYAYALEQLEAAFYIQLIVNPYSNMSANERSLLGDIRNHEITHREFFKAALGSNAIPELAFDFSSVNFGDRTSVLATAKAFEDLGVSAYNGAGQFLTNPDFLTAAGKIVSVEARHAALIRDLISNGSFAGPDSQIVNGLDVSRTPSEVLGIAKTYIKTNVTANNLPS